MKCISVAATLWKNTLRNNGSNTAASSPGQVMLITGSFGLSTSQSSTALISSGKNQLFSSITLCHIALLK